MAQFRFVITGDKLEVLSPLKTVSDSINANSAVFSFRTEDWDGLVKWVHFCNPECNDGIPYDFNLIDDCISADRGLNLPAGIWDVYLHGEVTETVDGLIKVAKRLVTSSVSIKVEQSGILDGSVLPEINPSAAEQIDVKASMALAARITSATAEVEDVFGTPECAVTILGEAGERILHFEFTGIKGNGIETFEYVASGENTGRVHVVLSDGRVRDYDGLKEAMAAFRTFSDQATASEAERVLAEAERAFAESVRISAENARISSENTRNTKELERINAENTRSSNETTRQNNETTRINSETGRVSAEADRVSAEADRVSAERARDSSEIIRINSETARVSAEQSRASAEVTRVSNETTRVSQESVRDTSEQARISAENTRVSNENARISAENTRVSNEATRVSNEQVRVKAEEDRQEEWGEWGDIVTDSEAYARGTRHGTPVDSSDPAYHNNGAYYVGQAQAAISAAEAARDAALSAQDKAEDAQEAAEIAAATFETDQTLSELGKAADAEVVGNRFIEVDNTKIDDGYVENGLLYLTANGEVVAGPFECGGGGGGGGGGGNNAIMTIQNTSGWLTKSIALGASCEITFSWSSLEDEIPTGNGTLQVVVNSSLKITRDVAQGNASVEVGEYLTAGNNAVKIVVNDVYGNTRTINFTVKAVAVSITSTFDSSVPQTSDIVFPYTPNGNVTKTVYFVLDGSTIGTSEVTTSGRQQTYTIPAQTHGRHTLLVYFVCSIDEETVRSNDLYYELICLEDGVTTPIITSNYLAQTAEQYVAQNISYYVYTPSYLESQVTLWANGEQVGNTLTVDRTEQIWSYRPDEIGDLTLEIKSGTASRVFNLEITESTIHVEPVTEELVLYLNSFGRSNTDADRATWVYDDISCSFSGFNWTSDGWQFDSEGNTALRLAGDARLTIPYKIFERDFRGTGKTIEIDFATRNILNYDAVIFSCLSEGRGLSLTAQKAVIASEQSSLFTQYKEDEHVRLSFVVEKRAENRLLICYINGIMSGVVQYPDDDDFSQSTPVNITVGSNYCGIDLYCIRVYDNDLTRDQILDNWIADTQTIESKLDRYNRNDVLDEYGNIVIAKLPIDLPYLVLSAPVLPQYKGDKKTISGYYVDPSDPTKSFTFNGAQADVQGTSSQYYARKNYKIKFKGGFIVGGQTISKYAMRTGAIPTDTFTFKADVASSEGANNVELARLYNDSCPYKTPPQLEDASVRQGIDGFPIVVFWDNGTDITFIGKYNFNNDKGTEEVFGFEEGDESWETLNNTSDRVVWKDDDYSGVAWQNDFEGRYPDGNTDPTNLAALASWLVSTDQEQATGDTLAEPVTLKHRTYDLNGNLIEVDVTYTEDSAAYRLDKFRDELEDHMVVDSVLFYYLFTELFLMVDSRAKNAFPTLYQGDDGLWSFLPYDFDTALGINNEGSLAFGYELEDIDTTSGGANVYNGQNSVLWINVRQGFFEELKTMYKSLRSEGTISYDNVEDMFENHQEKWPEAIFNEDSFFKYIEPLINDGDGSYLEMCLGSKAEQRKWWLYNRFRYIDSKYNAGDALTDYIDMRSYARSSVTIVPYADIYPTMKFGSYLVSERGQRNTPTILNCPGTFTPNDTETQIYCASQLASVGDLSGLKLGRCDFHMATRLQSLKIGDDDSEYTNGNLTSLTLGNNVLLQTLDVRNCPNLTQAVDISGCVGIEEVYFDGTAITGLSLPNGGQLRIIHLPSTITNLTIRNHNSISDFTLPDYSNITTLRLENVNSVVPSLEILEDIPANSRVRLIGVNWSFSTAADALDIYDLLDTMRGLDESGNNLDYAVISGTINVTNITGAQLAEMLERQPNVQVVYEHITSNLYYYNYDGSDLLYTETIADGGDGVYTGTPSRSSTAQYSYTFAGWSLTTNSTSADSGARTNVTSDRNVYAAYTATVRTYTVRYMNGSTVLQTYNNVPYGSSVTYTGTTPVHPTDPTQYAFNGFNPTGENITGNTDCLAQWRDLSSITRKLLNKTITEVNGSDIDVVGDAAFYSTLALTTVNLPATTIIGEGAFQSCSNLATVSLPVATDIGSYAFQGCYSLTTIDLPSVTSIEQYAFQNCINLTTVSLPVATSIGFAAFISCSELTTISLPSATTIGSSAFQNCYSLTTIYLPVATDIGGNVFYLCRGLTTIDLPTISYIGSSAFHSCGSLLSVILRNSSIVARLGNSNAFTNANSAIIYVHDDLVSSYKTSTNWSYISSRIKGLSELQT